MLLKCFWGFSNFGGWLFCIGILGLDRRGGGGVERLGLGILIGGGWEMGILILEEIVSCDFNGGELKGGGFDGGKILMDVREGF